MSVRAPLLAAILAILGCGPSVRTPSRSVASVAFVGSWDDTSRSKALSAIDLHRARFEARYGPIGGHAVEVHRGALLPSGNVGEALLPAGFRVASGLDMRCAGATHELHHLAHDWSLSHSDPRWPVWDAEDAAVVAELAVQ